MLSIVDKYAWPIFCVREFLVSNLPPFSEHSMERPSSNAPLFPSFPLSGVFVGQEPLYAMQVSNCVADTNSRARRHITSLLLLHVSYILGF